MTETNPISFALIVSLVVVAAVVYFVFRINRTFVLPLIRNRKSHQFFSQLVFRVEVLSWGLFLAFSIYEFFTSNPLLTLTFLAIVIIIGWPFWKDFIPGLLFRLENEAYPEDSIYFDNKNCIIENIGLRNIRMKNENGDIILLPYSRLKEVTISKSVLKGKFTQNSFTVEMKDIDKHEAVLLLKKILHECPWAVPAKEPIIIAIEKYCYEVTIFSIDNTTLQRQRKYVETRVLNNNH